MSSKPVTMATPMDEKSKLFERIVQGAMKTLGWSRPRAEQMARKTIDRVHAGAIATAVRAKRQASKRKKGIAALPPARSVRSPRDAKERLERALGPDDGPRRGGSPVVQGGALGLGKRR